MDYMSQLPIELLITIISLSPDTPDPVHRLNRIEEPRLVNRRWQAAIDSTPHFWTCIPNELRSLETIKGWIQKSGEAPLHILSTKYHRITEPDYMQLVVPHIHRWRKLEIADWAPRMWKYISKPAPMLEGLLISHTSIPSDQIAFGGITPSLSSVELIQVTIPENTTFLRNLKELQLRGIRYCKEDSPLSKFRDILDACPDLEKLQLDACYSKHPLDQPPVLLAKLSSFSIRGDPGIPECTEAILDMITAPSLSDFYLP